MNKIINLTAAALMSVALAPAAFAQEAYLPAITPACVENPDGCREFEISDSSGTISDLTVFRGVKDLLEINGLSKTHGPDAKLPKAPTLTIKL